MRLRDAPESGRSALDSGANVLYSDDEGGAKFAAACCLAEKRVIDLPVPASQQAFQFSEGDAQAGTAREPALTKLPKPNAEDEESG